MPKLKQAPELIVREWLNCAAPISLSQLRGRVVMIEAFQMLCPGCVSHGLPQAKRVAQIFGPDQVTVLGLHTVFEHAEAQGSAAALGAFLHEYNIGFPVAIDAPTPKERIPQTMRAYALQGTPTLILIDKAGFIRRQKFGMTEDLLLGAEIATLIAEESNPATARVNGRQDEQQPYCDEKGCMP